MRKGQYKVTQEQEPGNVASTWSGESPPWSWRTAGLLCPLKANFLDQMTCQKGGWVDRSQVPGWEVASFPAALRFFHKLGPTLGCKGWERLLRETISRLGSLESVEGPRHAIQNVN